MPNTKGFKIKMNKKDSKVYTIYIDYMNLMEKFNIKTEPPATSQVCRLMGEFQ